MYLLFLIFWKSIIDVCVRACACPCVSVQPGLHVPPPLPITKKIFLLYFGNQFHPFKKKKNLSLENGCCLIKLSFHGYCWVLLGFTMGLPGFTEFYLVFFSAGWMRRYFTGLYRVLPSFTGFCSLREGESCSRTWCRQRPELPSFLPSFSFVFFGRLSFPHFKQVRLFFMFTEFYRVLLGLFFSWHGTEWEEKDTRKILETRRIRISTNKMFTLARIEKDTGKDTLEIIAISAKNGFCLKKNKEKKRKKEHASQKWSKRKDGRKVIGRKIKKIPARYSRGDTKIRAKEKGGGGPKGGPVERYKNKKILQKDTPKRYSETDSRLGAFSKCPLLVKKKRKKKKNARPSAEFDGCGDTKKKRKEKKRETKEKRETEPSASLPPCPSQ